MINKMEALLKFHGSRTKLEGPLKKVLAWCMNPFDHKKSELKKSHKVVQHQSSKSYRDNIVKRKNILELLVV